MDTEWRKEPPDEVGFWLRINAINKPTITWAVRIDGVLNVHWDEALLKRDHPKLARWWWKPLPLPPEIRSTVFWEY